MSFAISSLVAGVNADKEGGEEGGGVWGKSMEELDCKLERRLFILVEKNEANLFDRSVAFSNEGREIVEVRSKRLLIVFQRDFGLDLLEAIRV